MKKLKFKKLGLAGDVFYNPQMGRRYGAIYLYGFPAFIGPTKLTQSLVGAGTVVFQPQYYGTYDSDGQFSPETMLLTYSTSQSIFDDGYVDNVKDGSHFDLPSQLKISAGHSFGCLAALRAIHLLPTVEVLLLFAPALHYRNANPDYGLREDGMEQLDYVRRACPHTYRLAPDADWREILEGRDPLPIPRTHPRLSRVICVLGLNDKYFDIKCFREGYEQLIRSHVGDSPKIQLITIPEAGHSLDELLDNDRYLRLDQILA